MRARRYWPAAVIVVVWFETTIATAVMMRGSAKTDDQRAGSDLKLGLVDASGLARRQRHVGGESRRTNHRRYRNRGNNTFKTEHRLSPVI